MDVRRLPRAAVAPARRLSAGTSPAPSSNLPGFGDSRELRRPQGWRGLRGAFANAAS